MRMMTLALAAAALPVTLTMAEPAWAQTNTRTITVYGKDPCPTSNGEEIVVCSRLPEEERFRIPKGLREGTISPESTAGAVRNQRIVDQEVAGAGNESCSTVGPGGASGCFVQQARRNRASRQEQGEEPLIGF